MSNGQKIIKYIAIAFAVFLIVNIVSWSILGLSLLLGITAFGEKEETINEAEQKVQFSEQGEQIKNLKIDISISQLIIQKSDHFNVEVKSEKDIVSATLKENTLYIENTKKEPFFNWNPEDSQIIVSLPSSISLNNVEIDSGVGTVQIEELNCSNLKMDLGVGSAKIGNLIANQAKIDSGAGRLEIQKADITNLDLDCGVGETLITGVLKGEN